MTIPLPLAELFQALADPSRLRLLALLREGADGRASSRRCWRRASRGSRGTSSPRRRAAGRAAQGRQLGLPQLGEPALADGAGRAVRRAGRSATDPPVRRRPRAPRSGARRPGRGRRALFRRARCATGTRCARSTSPRAQVEDAIARSARRAGRSVGCSISAPAPAGCSNCSAPGRQRGSASTARPRCCGWRGQARGAAVGRAELRQGDMSRCRWPTAAPTHHPPPGAALFRRPAPAIAEAARLLRPGGRLLVVDFAAA